jgi:hypothetical protein
LTEEKTESRKKPTGEGEEDDGEEGVDLGREERVGSGVGEDEGEN